MPPQSAPERRIAQEPPQNTCRETKPPPASGRSHGCEPEDTDDQIDAVWFEHVDGEEEQYLMPAQEDALHRLHWHEAQLWRLGYSTGLAFADVASIVFALIGRKAGEEEAYQHLEALVNAAGHDTYHSDTRFLVFPRGVRKECDGGCDGCCAVVARPSVPERSGETA